MINGDDRQLRQVVYLIYYILRPFTPQLGHYILFLFVCCAEIQQ